MNREEIKKSFEELQKQLEDLGKAKFKEVCDYLFQKHSLMESFSFHAYIPSFSDGDICEFSVNHYHDSMSINGVNYYDLEDELPDKHGALEAILKDVSSYLQVIPEDIYKVMFGDSFTITVKRDGSIETDEAPDHE